MELELENTIIGSASTRKSKFEYWTTKIDTMKNKLKDKNYRGHEKLCLRTENHANGTTHFSRPL
jgi:hypothetical protein